MGNRAGKILGLRLAVGAGLLIGSLGVSLAVGSAVGAAPGGSPPGNNGTIKIGDFDVDNNGNGNEPHIECPFTISYYGFDLGTQTSQIAFQAQPPSGHFTPVAPTEGPSQVMFQGSGPGDQLDHTDTYQLDVTGLTEQPQQGFHIKVMVDVTGSQGSDSKFKVFWYQPCSSSTTPPSSPPTSTPTTPSSPTMGPSTPSSSTGSSAGPGQGGSSSSAAATIPVQSSATIPRGAPGTGGTPPTITNVALETLGAVLAAIGGVIAALAAWRSRRVVA